MKNPMPAELRRQTDAMLDELAKRLCRFAGYMLGACAQVQGPNAPAPNLAWRCELAAARLAKFRLLCELRMLFEADDLRSNSAP